MRDTTPSSAWSPTPVCLTANARPLVYCTPTAPLIRDREPAVCIQPTLPRNKTCSQLGVGLPEWDCADTHPTAPCPLSMHLLGKKRPQSIPVAYAWVVCLAADPPAGTLCL
ncbi:hypothetical protein PMIN02_010656 [Paraphaeosphaeria minitans]